MLKISKGTNRLVILMNDKVVKIPIGLKGYYANKNENLNYSRSEHKDMIAKTELRYNCIIQEKLHDIEIFPYKITKEELPDYAKDLFDIRVHNRLQIGKDVNENYKIFDYEEIKYYINGD